MGEKREEEKKEDGGEEEEEEEEEEENSKKKEDDTMTFIRVPLVELVDITGRKIGKFSDEISFLDQIKDPPNDEEKVSAITSTSEDEDETEECKVIGETLIHIAIMYDDLDSIKYLIETKGMQCNQRSTGDDFVNGFEMKELQVEIKNSTYKGLAYYGEYPLALAACFANRDIYDYLVAKGGDPNLKGKYGSFVIF